MINKTNKQLPCIPGIDRKSKNKWIRRKVEKKIKIKIAQILQNLFC